MQQLDTLRERFDPNGKWFRVGVMSATAVAPLIARWNDLRTDKRAAELREQAVELREQAQARLGDVRARLSSGANDVLRQAAPLAERLPFVTVLPAKSKRRANTNLWLAGVAVGLVAAGVTAYIVARRRMTAPEEEEPMVELPLNGANGAWPTPPPSMESPVAGQAPMNSVQSTEAQNEAFGELDSMEDADTARFVGNIHTMIYHNVDDEAHLPAEENRIYFATEEDAHEAGFRRASSDVALGDEAQVSGTEGPSA
jgi:Metal binding domain of Ada